MNFKILTETVSTLSRSNPEQNLAIKADLLYAAFRSEEGRARLKRQEGLVLVFGYSFGSSKDDYTGLLPQLEGRIATNVRFVTNAPDQYVGDEEQHPYPSLLLADRLWEEGLTLQAMVALLTEHGKELRWHLADHWRQLGSLVQREPALYEERLTTHLVEHYRPGDVVETEGSLLRVRLAIPGGPPRYDYRDLRWSSPKRLSLYLQGVATGLSPTQVIVAWQEWRERESKLSVGAPFGPTSSRFLWGLGLYWLKKQPERHDQPKLSPEEWAAYKAYEKSAERGTPLAVAAVALCLAFPALYAQGAQEEAC